MSSQGYYGEGDRPPHESYNSGYGGYNQQQYPQQHYGGQQSEYGQPQYQDRGNYNQGSYSGAPPPSTYGETLGAPATQYSQNQRPHSPYEGEYNRPNYPQGDYGEGYPGDQQRYSPQPPSQAYPPPQTTYGEYRGGYQQSGQYQESYEGYPPPQGPPPGQEGAEGERGFLGALAGGAAGAYGGHKMNHGVLGALGGAVAGSMAQDHFKHKKEDKKHEQQMQQQMHQQQQHHMGGAPIPPRAPSHGNFAGNFSASSTQISLDRDFDLIASCSDTHGNHRLSSVSLNDCLSNEWGNFKWSRGGNFGASARNVRLVDGGRVLEAELGAGNGTWKRAHVFLDEKITNEDGELKYLG